MHKHLQIYPFEFDLPNLNPQNNAVDTARPGRRYEGQFQHGSKHGVRMPKVMRPTKKRTDL
jgi:hypothetical protein